MDTISAVQSLINEHGDNLAIVVNHSGGKDSQRMLHAVLSSVVLNGAVLNGAVLNGKKVHSLRVFTGLYRHEVWAILFADGERWVRMGCLWKSLEEWERVGIRKSNLKEFPNDGSETSEERARAFEFAKDAVLRMTLPVQAEVTQ